MPPAASPERMECVLRGACAAMAGAGAGTLLLGLSPQTKTVLFIQRKAVPKDVQALWGFVVSVFVLYSSLTRKVYLRLHAGFDQFLSRTKKMRVHGVRDDGGGAAGVHRGAHRRGGAAVEQAATSRRASASRPPPGCSAACSLPVAWPSSRPSPTASSSAGAASARRRLAPGSMLCARL
ncbi:unnamed protein product [Urochloa humidicola]